MAKEELFNDSHSRKSDSIKSIMSMDIGEVWIIDSGASCHMTYRREWLTDYRPITEEVVSLSDDMQCAVSGKGTVNIKKLINGQWSKARIENVLHVPQIKKNLFSVGASAKKGFCTIFNEQTVIFKKDKSVQAVGYKQSNDIYRLLFKVITRATHFCEEANISATNLQTWHERLGHINVKTLKQAVENTAVQGIKLSSEEQFFCEPCQFGKGHRLKFNKNKSQENHWTPGELIHSDICGPFSETSIGGSKYYLLFLDEATNYRYVYFIKHKSDVLEKFKEFDNMIKNRFGHSIKILRVDNGREYTNHQMKYYLRSRGITMQNSAPYTPEQNGKAERENRTIIESARSMLQARNLPVKLWAEAVNTAVYILNRVAIKDKKKITPFEAWHKKKPELSHMRIFDSNVYAHINKQFRHKMDKKTKKLILVGYQADSTNYRLWDPQTNKISISRDVVINENISVVQNTNTLETYLTNLETDAEEIEETDNTNIHSGHESDEEKNDLEHTTPHATPARNLRDRKTLHPPRRYESNFAQYIIPETFQETVKG